ncbi:AimR family lysis-lysogeny pheromone receptor [Bacillus paramycoides]|uniref:AimR family lysis-lysogeny pheromone receptor n=1 Tax=Bacillus paramycoides TaxID=2026194 RepID=UPI003D06CB33
MNQISERRQEEKKKELLSFLGILIDEIDFQRRIQDNLAKEIGITPGAFSRNLAGKSQLSFWSLIKLLNIIYADNIAKKQKMIYKFCAVTTSKKNLRIAMEYANAKGDLILLKQVVDRERHSSLAMNREWAYVYELVWLRGSGTIQGTDLLDKLEERKQHKVTKTNEMKALYDILICYIMYDLENFNSLFEYATLLKPKVDEIADNFIRTAFEGRMKEFLSYAYLMHDDVEKCRELCQEILKIKGQDDCFALLKTSASVYLAESYTFECYETSARYIKQALNLLETDYYERAKQREKQILNTYAFIKLVNKCDLEDIKVFHPAEGAFLEIRKGNKEKAISILSELKSKNGFLTPIEYCYLGLATNDIELIKKSIELFECGANRFYSKLPKKVLGYFNKNGIMCEGD